MLRDPSAEVHLFSQNGHTLFARIHPSLPIYCFPIAAHFALYTPGSLEIISEDQMNNIFRKWITQQAVHDMAISRITAFFEEQAANNQLRWELSSMAVFSPECLTVYLSNDCNSGCLYCYTANARQRKAADAIVELEAVLAAARLVARSCRKNNNSFKLVIHGGGEPTLHWQLLQQLVDETKKIAASNKIEWWAHIATNGIVTQQQAVWLSKTFQSIGISHDGPPEIHNVQRPLKNGRPSTPWVERTIKTVVESKGSFYIRTTLLPTMIHRLDEIVGYISHYLQAKTIRIEPGYHLNMVEGNFSEKQADVFVKNFLAIEKNARKNGVHLSLSGIRLGELHGSYCNTSRNTVHIVPGNIATACFFASDKVSAERAGVVVGKFNKSLGEFILDNKKIRDHCLRAGNIPATCKNCICIYHCSRGCPDVCLTRNTSTRLSLPFRCRTAQLLTVNTLSEQATRRNAISLN